MKGKLFLVLWGEDLECRACGLRDSGWFVDVESEDGGQAYRLIRAEAPAVVVIDMGRRPSHGRKVARALQETQATRDLPLVFVDASVLDAEKARNIAPGALFTTWQGLDDLLERFT